MNEDITAFASLSQLYPLSCAPGVHARPPPTTHTPTPLLHNTRGALCTARSIATASLPTRQCVSCVAMDMQNRPGAKTGSFGHASGSLAAAERVRHNSSQ
ncbi:hypothetical protein EON66_12505 [archaeon]|nr:MAG: hypothetical protein EON66_12505 [archaeon]